MAKLPVLCVALALSGAVDIATQLVPWRTVVPGVEHAQVLRERGPWNINLLRVDPARVTLDIVHAHNTAIGLETVSAIARRLDAIAAVNGGYFRMKGVFAGDSTGTLQINGTLLSEPDRGRAAVGLVRRDNTTHLVMGYVKWEGAVEVAGRKRRLNGLNRPRGRNEIVLFTPEFEQSTRTDPSGVEAIVRGGRVDRIVERTGDSRIPSDGFVLSATGTGAAWIRANARPGARVSIAARLQPADRVRTNPWPAAEDVLGAGPMLVSNGRIGITAAREKMRRGFDTERHPRTAVAALADGRVLLVTVDGRQPGVSVGMSLDEIAKLLLELGATNAMNLDGGGSTTMVVGGMIVNRPSDVTGERPVSDAIVIR